MRKVTLACLLSSTLFLICLVIYQAAKKPKNSDARFEVTKQMITTYADVHTRTVPAEEYGRLIQKQVDKIVNFSSDGQRKKLVTKLLEFYECYYTGNFDAYKRFRIQGNYSLGSGIAALANRIASERGDKSPNNEELLRLVWDQYNGTNRLNQFDPDSIIVSITNRHDLNMDWRRPSNLLGFTTPAMRCWDGAVVYSRTAETILKENNSILMATVDLFARFNSITNGPATPLRLAFYWDPYKEEWMPLALCTTIKVGNFNTIF